MIKYLLQGLLFGFAYVAPKQPLYRSFVVK